VKMKGRVYRACVRATMVYGGEDVGNEKRGGMCSAESGEGYGEDDVGGVKVEGQEQWRIQGGMPGCIPPHQLDTIIYAGIYWRTGATVVVSV
jgi:hypothetical protein